MLSVTEDAEGPIWGRSLVPKAVWAGLYVTRVWNPLWLGWDIPHVNYKMNYNQVPFLYFFPGTTRADCFEITEVKVQDAYEDGMGAKGWNK